MSDMGGFLSPIESRCRRCQRARLSLQRALFLREFSKCPSLLQNGESGRKERRSPTRVFPGKGFTHCHASAPIMTLGASIGFPKSEQVFFFLLKSPSVIS